MTDLLASFRHRSARIVATLGPSSSDIQRIEQLVEAGVDVFRFNFSHGSHEDHAARYRIVRTIEQRRGRPIGVLADLQGPKLRIGTFENGGVELSHGARIRLDMDPAPGDALRVNLPHKEIYRVIEPGQELLVDDGKTRLFVDRVHADFIETTVTAGGKMSNRKGVNVPGALLPISALTEKDRRDLSFALDMGADWIALSFVQRPEDLAEARRLIQGRAALMAKIEKPSAIDTLDRIIEQCDGIMVARGDLGVEMPPETVPGLQKRIVRACRDQGRPVIVATQMLESMIEAPTPTRAEASDVATAVYDGADALMLSAETAAGSYPIEAVRMMDRVMRRVERDPLYRSYLDAYRAESVDLSTADAITSAAAKVAHTMQAAAIVTYTTSGATAIRAARDRPSRPILGLINRLATARRLALLWGVHCVMCPDVESIDQMITVAIQRARQSGIAEPNQSLVITAGYPYGTPGRTNLLHIAWVR